MKFFGRFFILSTLLLFTGSIFITWPISQAQTKSLTYPEIITALNTKIPNKSFKSRAQLHNFLMTQIRKRRVAKPLSSEVETLLREAGATDQVIKVIEENIKPQIVPHPSLPNSARMINVGVMNSRAISLAKPAYPKKARQAGASGQVVVEITVDENGQVLSAQAVSGHDLLREASEAAARQSTFHPVKVGERVVKVAGKVVYNFINQ